MTRDATLDAFGTSQETDDADEPNRTDETGEPNELDETSTPNESDETEESDPGPERVAVTTDWSPGGARCSACNATVERRWQHQGSLVCPNCKDWRER